MSRRVLVVTAFALGVVAVPVGSLLISALSQAVVAQDAREIPDDLLRARRGAVVAEPEDVVLSPHQEYLELAKQKLRLLTPEQLARETEKLRRELLELEANQKLQEAEIRLQQLVEQHPGSAAATRARAMLDLLRQQNPQDFRLGAPVFDPSGDSNRDDGSNDENNYRSRRSTFGRDEIDQVVPTRTRPVPKPVPNSNRQS